MAGESFFKNCVDNGFLNDEDWHLASQKEEYEYLTDCFQQVSYLAGEKSFVCPYKYKV